MDEKLNKLPEKCCICGNFAEYYTEIGSPIYKEYLCRRCAINNEEAKRKK